MNISQIVLCNFGGVEGRFQFDIAESLNEFPKKSAVIDGIRFVLDRTFKYEERSNLPSPSVEIELRNIESGARLRLIRTVEENGFIQIGDALVALEEYIKDFGEALGAIGEELFTLIRDNPGKNLPQLLVNEDIQRETPFDPANEDHSDVAQVFQKWKGFVRKRSRLIDVPERNLQIKRCKILDKCRKLRVQEMLSETLDSFDRQIASLSADCNDIQSKLHLLWLDIIKDKKTSGAVEMVRMKEYYSFNSDVSSHFDELISTLNGSAERTAKWILDINRRQNGNFWTILEQENPGQENKSFQLELKRNCLQLSKLPEVPVESLEMEKMRLNLRYSYLLKEYKEEQKGIEDLLRENADFLSHFNYVTTEIGRELEEEMKALQKICSTCSRKVQEFNDIELVKINLKAKLEEIKEVLDYDESVLIGLSSVLRLMDSPEYRELKEREFLGPIFQAIQFKEDEDVAALTYFRLQLKDWFPIIVVKTSKFAQKLMADFNKKRMKGTITVLSCDNYRQRADEERKVGVPLTEVIIDGENNPFMNLLSNIIYNETEDFLSTEGDCIKDSITGGLTMRINATRDISAVQTEKLLEEYFTTEEELIELERNELPEEKIREIVESQFEVILDKISHLSCSTGSFYGVMDRQRVIQSMIGSLNRMKEELNSIDWKQKINNSLINLVKNGELKREPQFYEREIDELIKQPREGSIRRYNPMEVEELILQFNHEISSNFPTLFWPFPREILTTCFWFIDVDIPHVENLPELIADLQDGLGNIRTSYREYLKLKGMKLAYEKALTSIEVDDLHTRGHSRKSLHEIEQELIPLDRNFNVTPRSKIANKKITNFTRRIVKKMSKTMDPNLPRLPTDLSKFLAQKRVAFSVDKIDKLLLYIDEFYEDVRPEPVNKVAITYQSKVHAEQLSIADISAVQVVFNTPQGNLSAHELDPSALEIFCFAVIFAKMKVNETNKLITIKDCENIDAQVLERIIVLFLSHDFQIILQRDDQLSTPQEMEYQST